MNRLMAFLLVMLAGTTNIAAQQPGGWRMTGRPATWHVPFGTTATPLKNGKVLVVGSSPVLDHSRAPEIYDPETGEWTTTGNLITPRYGHVAVPMNDGRVLVAGGHASGTVRYVDGYLASAEIYDPTTGTWSAAGNLSVPREAHTAHVLPDGRTLVIGGETVVRDGLSESYVAHASADIYDPVTGIWSSAGTMPSAHARHASVLLANGTVLVIGGIGRRVDDLFGRRVEIFDPATRTWRMTGNLTTWRQNKPTATLLPDGKVLLAGGSAGTGADTAELYDPGTEQWSVTGRMTVRRRDHTATLLPGGKVLAAGGYADDEDFDGKLTEWDAAEIYDPATGQWTLTGRMNALRYGHAATLLTNGKVLVVGGYSNGSWSVTADLYDAALPLLILDSTSYCVGGAWSLRVRSVSPNSWIRLSGISDGKSWEVENWRQTDADGNYAESGIFISGSEGSHTIRLRIGEAESHPFPFRVVRCRP